jgi:transposase
VTTLGFVTAIDDPSRFRRLRDVAAYFGLTSRRWQSGTSIDVQGRISKAGDPDMRRSLYEAASALLTRFKCKEQGAQLRPGVGQTQLPSQGNGDGGTQVGGDQ